MTIRVYDKEQELTMEIIDSNTVFGFWPKRKADIALPTLLGLMEDNGVSRACTLSARGILYDFEEGNRETLEAAAEHSELIPVGTVNVSRWIGCLEEAQRLVDEGVRLLRFFPQYQEWHINQAPFQKLLKEVLAPAGVALMVPAMMGVTAIGEMAAGVSNPIIIDSLRYTFWSEAVVVMQQVPNVFVETHLGGWYEWITDQVGADRLVFGSNTPLSYFASARAQIEYAKIPASDQALIFSGNLRRILDI